jgi:transposase-like protein
METCSRPFVPPFCPRTDCPHHHCPSGWRYKKAGHYTRQCAPHQIQRYRCGHCGVTFSTQTFSTTYYLKRPELLEPLFFRLLACSGHRQVGREARCAHSTAMRQAARLGRHALLALQAARPAGEVAEPLVVDGFESFAFSQYHPLHLNVVVGAESHYVYAFTHARLRRKGRMTERQERRRALIERRHGRADPKAIEHGMAAALKLAAPRPQTLTVRSDEHPAYPRAFKRLSGYRVRHECTPSVAARTSGNPLFPVNLLDLLLRQNSSHLKRESIAFAKRHQAVIERAALLALWRNETKSFSENHGGGTPAMRLGLRATPQSPAQLLKARLFASRIALPEPWAAYYRGLEDTPGIDHPVRHHLKRAF